MSKFVAAKIIFRKEAALRKKHQLRKLLVDFNELDMPLDHQEQGATAVMRRIQQGESIYLSPEEAYFLNTYAPDTIDTITLYSAIRCDEETYQCPSCNRSGKGGAGVFSSWVGSTICDVCEPEKTPYKHCL